MKQVIGRIALASAAAFMGVASAATVDQCRALDGFKSSPQGGAWLVVRNNADAFLGKKETQNCLVKDVTPSAKGKPSTSYVEEGPMTMDQCSMYNYLSSIDSKLNSYKAADALTQADSMVLKINTMFTTSKLTQDGYNALFGAASALRGCIDELLNQ